jgi:UDP-glucose 4-epimerase
MNILLTGGTGYIGSHTAVTLATAAHNVVLYDNLSNSKANVVDKLQTITGRQLPFIQGDMRDTILLKRTLQEYQIDAVIHFAGLKAVGESVKNPIDYYANNVQGTISLLQAMHSCQIKSLVFSSSATVYGNPTRLPLDEDCPTQATNPYGHSKIHIEEMLRDVATSDKNWRIVCLRYFNPVGAHASGLIGEDPQGIPNNLMPFIAQVATGQRALLQIFGDNYDTSDGTGVRDYIHVMDLAEGHLAALDYLGRHTGWEAINLGTGQGYSVFEIVRAFEVASGRTISYKMTERRPGDIAACYAKVEKAKNILRWASKRNLLDMCNSTWQFQKNLRSE